MYYNKIPRGTANRYIKPLWSVKQCSSNPQECEKKKTE